MSDELTTPTSFRTNVVFTPEQMERGWNDTNYLVMKDLFDQADGFRKAHRSCRDRNRRFDKYVNVPLVLSTSALTGLLATTSGSDSTEGSSPWSWAKYFLSFCSTALSAMNSFFENGKKAEEHHAYSRLYFQLSQKIDRHLKTRKTPFDATFDKCNKMFSDIRGGSPSLFKKSRKKYEHKPSDAVISVTVKGD